MATGTCTIHSWNDGADSDEADPPMGAKVNARLQWDPEFSDGQQPEPQHESSVGGRIRRGLRSWRTARRFANMDGDDWGS
jgi:WD repeat-containing protein 23